MKKIIIIILSGLLFIACGSRTNSDILGDLPFSKEYLDSTLTEDALGGCLMVMDATTGELLIDYSVCRDSLNGPKDCAIEPGYLLSPMVMASILDDPNMNLDLNMRVKVGCQYYPSSYCVKDFNTCFDGVDSLPLHRAIALHSEVALCELGKIFFSSCRDSLKARLSRMVDFSNDSWHIRDMGRLLVDPERKKHLEMYRSRMFYNMCCGRGATVNPRDILNFYNSLATKQCKTAESLRGLLMETAKTDIGRAASAHRIAGLSANVLSGIPSPSRLTSSFVGFFPADNPRFTCMVIKYGSTHAGKEVAKLFVEIADALMNRVESSERALADSSVMRIMVMDRSTGHMVVNQSVGDNGSVAPNDKIAIAPGELLFPIMLASLGKEIDTATLKLRVGRKEYDNGCMIADSYVPIDPYANLPYDSLSVMRAMEIHSHVAMTELGRQFYHNRRNLLQKRICEMLPGVEFTSLGEESPDSDFGSYCRGERMKVPLVSLLNCYRRSDVESFVKGGRMASWETIDVDGKDSDICIGYSPDRKNVALVIVSHNPMPSAVFEQLFRK